MSGSFETIHGGTRYFLFLTDTEVVAGSGAGHTESAGACSHDAFLRGEFHDHVREVFGDPILREAFDAVRVMHGVAPAVPAQPPAPPVPPARSWTWKRSLRDLGRCELECAIIAGGRLEWSGNSGRPLYGGPFTIGTQTFDAFLADGPPSSAYATEKIVRAIREHLLRYT